MSLTKIYRLPWQVGDALNKVSPIGGITAQVLPDVNQVLVESRLRDIHTVFRNKGYCPTTIECSNVRVGSGLDNDGLKTIDNFIDQDNDLEDLEEWIQHLNSGKFKTYRMTRYDIKDEYTFIEVLFS